MSADEGVVLPLDCETVVRELWAYLDGEVAPERLERLEDHLERCAYCRSHAEFEHRLMEELAELRERHSNPLRLRTRVVETLRRAGLGQG